jgi:hypothetical protein
VQFYGSVETVSNDLKDAAAENFMLGTSKIPNEGRTSTERADFGLPSTVTCV